MAIIESAGAKPAMAERAKQVRAQIENTTLITAARSCERLAKLTRDAIDPTKFVRAALANGSPC